MRDTAGMKIQETPDFCGYCQLDTAGKHEAGCPMFGKPNVVIVVSKEGRKDD